MIADLSYAAFTTSAGWVGVLASPRGLLLVTLPQKSEEETINLLGERTTKSADCSPAHFADLIKRLKLYFSGHRVEFPDALDLNTATAFQRAVWKAVRLIPYGETRSYTWAAQQIGKPQAVRAAGQALGKNPLPIIIPCHRVLTADGKLGGFSGGLEMKQYLLKLEGAG